MNNIDLSIVIDYIRQLDQANSSEKVFRSLQRNFVGYFLPEKAVLLKAPNSEMNLYSVAEKYGVSDLEINDLPANGAVEMLLKNKNQIIKIPNLSENVYLKEEIQLMQNFSHILPITNHSLVLGFILVKKDFSEGINQDLASFFSLHTSIALKNYFDVKDLHKNQITKLLNFGALSEFIDHYRQICKDLVNEGDVSFDFGNKTPPYDVLLQGPTGLNSMETGFSILMININGLTDLEQLGSSKLVDKIRNEFAFKFKMSFRKSDIVGHFKRDALICLMPYTLKNDAAKMVPEFESLLKKMISSNGLPVSADLSVQYSLGHYPEDGEESFMLIKYLEENLV